MPRLHWRLKRQTGLSWLISVALHLALVLLFLWEAADVHRELDQSFKSKFSPNLDFTDIEVREIRPFKIHPGTGKNSKTVVRGRAKRLTLADLSPLPPQDNSGTANSDNLEKMGLIEDGYQVSDSGAPLSGKQVMALLPGSSLYRYIFDRLNEFINYPPEFTANGIQGNVIAQVWFAPHGDFLKSDSVVQSSSPYLRVLVWRALRNAFRTRLPTALLHSKEKFVVHCNFAFELTEHSVQMYADAKNRVLGNVLYFYRHFPHSKLQWDLGPLHGFWLMPSVGLDVMWFWDKARRATSKKKIEDPLDLTPWRSDPDW